MIIDAHYHLEERLQTVDDLLTAMREHHVDRVALIPPGLGLINFKGLRRLAYWLPKLLMQIPCLGMFFYTHTLTADNQFSVLGTRYPIYDAPDNAGVARMLEKYPDKFYGWIFINPHVMDPVTELDKFSQQSGWIGAKALPFWQRYNLDRLDDAARWCAERGWPMLVHLGNRMENGDWRYLPERHPDLNIIYAHAGIPFYRDVWAYARGQDHVFVDLSNPVYVDKRVRLEAVRALGAQKCVHGTDGPYGDAGQGKMLRRVMELSLRDVETARILGDNFAELMPPA
jgi:predicted TIM-barrel fold metal-dependent hydrolase